MIQQNNIRTRHQWQTKNQRLAESNSLLMKRKLEKKLIWHHYMGVHHLKRVTAACERDGLIHNAKIILGSSLRPELFKQCI